MNINEAREIKRKFEQLNIICLTSSYVFNDIETKIKYSFERNSNNGMYEEDNNFIEYNMMRTLFNCNTLFNNEKAIIFEKSKNIEEDKITYPIIITCINTFTLFDDEVHTIKQWALLNNEKERIAYLKDNKKLLEVNYYSLKDDIFKEWNKKLLDCEKTFEEEWERIVMRTIHLEGDILITDPCYWIKNEDWGIMKWDNNFKKYGIKESICRDTLYGDWNCTVYNIDTKSKIGTFCADAGMVCVCLLDEVKNYSGNKIDKYIENGAATVINDFNGDIHFVIIENELQIEGCGNINFIAKQTGL